MPRHAFAYAALVVFHVLTWRLFAIGVFPWVMIAATTIFFDPSWPRRLTRQRPMGVWGTVPSPKHPSVVIAAAVVWAAVMVAVPLRHLAYKGDVRWTEEGYYGSFRVMLTEKAGLLHFEVTDPVTGERWTVEPTLVLTEWQARQAAIRPELAVAAAHLVADELARDGHPDVEVRADSWVSFNGRPRQRMIDPAVDIAALSRRPGASEYVLPLDPPVVD